MRCGNLGSTQDSECNRLNGISYFFSAKGLECIIPTLLADAKRVCHTTFGTKGFADLIVHFTVTFLVAKPLNTSEAKGDLVMIQTLLLFRCKLLSYHAN